MALEAAMAFGLGLMVVLVFGNVVLRYRLRYRHHGFRGAVALDLRLGHVPRGHRCDARARAPGHRRARQPTPEGGQGRLPLGGLRTDDRHVRAAVDGLARANANQLERLGAIERRTGRDLLRERRRVRRFRDSDHARTICTGWQPGRSPPRISSSCASPRRTCDDRRLPRRAAGRDGARHADRVRAADLRRRADVAPGHVRCRRSWRRT